MQAVRRSTASIFARGRQRGQALIFGLFVLISGLAALFFFFNVGQLSREKTKLVNTADAVAYSAGVIHARALNFNAYSNRALMADEVLIAQMVSISSWAGYVGSWAANLPSVHPECRAAANGNPVGAIGLFKFGDEYLFGCTLLQLASQNGIVENTVDLIQIGVEAAVSSTEASKLVIQAAQAALNPLGAFEERRAVMTAVANANYQGDGEVAVDLLSPTLPDDWLRMADGKGGVTPFVRQYAGDERTRFKEVTVAAANKDPFVQRRFWTSKAPAPEPRCLALAWQWRKNEVRRRGGTELFGFDEWQAVDTQSYHENFAKKRRWVGWRCRQRENPTGVGGEQARAKGANQGPGAAAFGGSRANNPRAHAQALSAASGRAMGYSGLPSYHDLNQIWLRDRPNDEPKLLHGVRLTRSATNLRTTDGTTGQIRSRPDSRIGAYDTAVAGGEMAAVSASEVYFERPANLANNLANNSFGVGIGRPRELGSLFNPYWQVRLASSNAVSEWLRQGVTP
jgi:hypothetical protein